MHLRVEAIEATEAAASYKISEVGKATCISISDIR